MRRLIPVGLLAFSAACATDSATGPDLRSSRATEGGGKPVWDTYVLTVDVQASGGGSFSLFDYADTLRFDPTGKLIAGGPRPTLDEPQPFYISPFPFEKGDTVSLSFRHYRGNEWLSAPEPFLFNWCSLNEEAARLEPYTFIEWDCRESDVIAIEFLTGVVQPNGTVVGVDTTYGEYGERSTGTFTLTPIRGNRNIVVDPPVVFDTLLETRTLYVDEGQGIAPYVYRIYLPSVVSAFGEWYGNELTATTDDFDFAVPGECTRVENELHCTADAVLPMQVVITIRDDAQWYTTSTGAPVTADLSGQTITVTVIDITATEE